VSPGIKDKQGRKKKLKIINKNELLMKNSPSVNNVQSQKDINKSYNSIPHKPEFSLRNLNPT
jgi:hypothetical protein